MDLDRIDRAILTQLQKDARISNKELAAAVGLAPSSCHGRVRRLVEQGALRGFHADVAPRARGVGLQALVSVQLSGNPQTRLASFLDHALAQEEVVEAFQTSGANDLLLLIAVRDVEHMRHLVMDVLASRDEVAHLESVVVYGHHRTEGLPDLV